MKRKFIIKRLKLLSTTFVGIVLVFGLILTLTGNIPSPADPTWLYNYQAEFRTKLKGDKLIGGGYDYFPEGRDLWIRFRATENSLEALNLTNQACEAEQLERIRQWFLENVSKPNKILSWMTPWENLSPEDLESLNDISNLRCLLADEINNEFGKTPTQAGFWLLCNQQTNFCYMRYANYN